MLTKRITDALTDMEHQTWRARLHKDSALLDYLDRNCVMLSPHFGMLGSSTEPTLSETLESDNFAKWASYEISDVEVVELDLMAAVICYRLVAHRKHMRTGQTEIYKALVSSTWKQEASSKWKLCVHHECPIS